MKHVWTIRSPFTIYVNFKFITDLVYTFCCWLINNLDKIMFIFNQLMNSRY